MTRIQEKVNQAVEILKEQQTDIWLTFVRETSGVRDPMLDFLIGPNDLTWPSALILTRKGEKIAIIEILRDYLKGTQYADCLVSAEPIVNALRGRKTSAELERIRKAVEITNEIYKKTFDFIKIGMT